MLRNTDRTAVRFYAFLTALPGIIERPKFFSISYAFLLLLIVWKTHAACMCYK